VRIVAVDPGKVSGVAILEKTAFATPIPMAVELPGLLSTVSWVENERPDLVVCESFIPFRGAKTWQPDALEIIGALRFICARHEWTFELQSPANAKKFSTDRKLKKLGWYRATKGGHANDAKRHLLLALARHRLINPEELV
jgi:hypothetical protein